MLLRISLILLAILLFPIPFILSLSFINNEFALKVFWKKINLIKSKEKTKKTKDKDAKKKVKKKKNKHKLKIQFLKLLEKISCNKLKPTLRVTTSLTIGLDDASKTAITYGLLSAIYPNLIRFLEVIFKTKKSEYRIIPDFENKTIYFQFNCIIYLNLVKLIYMLYIFISCAKFEKTSSKESC